MKFCYTQISVLFSRHCSCGRWEQMQRPTAGPCAEWETSEYSVLKGMAPSSLHAPTPTPTPTGLSWGQGILQWRRRKVFKSWRGWRVPRKQSLLNTTGYTHIWLTKTGSMHRSCMGLSLMESQHWEEEIDTSPIPGFQLHFLHQSFNGCVTILKDRPHTQQ